MTDTSTSQDQVRDMRGGFFWANSALITKFGPKIGAYGIALYCVIAAHASNTTEEAFPSRDRMAELLGCSRRTVDKYLKVLEEHGLISIEKRFDANRQQSNLYRLLALNGGGAARAPGGVQEMHPGGAARAPELDLEELDPKELQEPPRSQPEHDLRRPLPLPQGARAGGSGGENTVKLFEDVFGFMPSPFMLSAADDLKGQYGYKALENAFKIAAAANKRSLSYVKGILRRDPSGGVQQPRSDGPKSAFWRPEEDAHDPAA